MQFEKKKMTHVIMTEECSPAVSLQTFKHNDLCTLTFRIYKICIPFSQKCNTLKNIIIYTTISTKYVGVHIVVAYSFI